MLRLRDISIRNKLVLMQVITSILVLGLFVSAYIITDIKAYKQRKVKATIALAQVIGTNSISTLQFEDSEAAVSILSDLQRVAPEIVYACILNKEGKIFAAYSKKGVTSLPVTENLAKKNSVFKDDQLFVSNDIVNENEVIGKTILHVELSELKQIYRSKYQMAGILLLIALVFSFIIAIILQSYMSRRLLGLVKNMEDVSRTGNYSGSIKDSGKDEIGILIKEFNKLMLQVKENQQRKDEFIGIASHELKTPLTSIKGYIELLNDSEADPANKQLIQKALTNANKLERLIKDLLDVSKIQSGQLELDLAEFDIDKMLDETVSSLQMLSKTHRIARTSDLKGQLILADRQRIEQVLTNLISNAIKYSPGQSEVVIHSNKSEEEVIISVRDFGIGIPLNEQVNVFDRFYRPKEIAAVFSGFGLGLYICRDIIFRHGGRIWINSEDNGTSFYFSLPLKQAK